MSSPGASLDFENTAAEHKAEAAASGQPWQCTCAACIQVREGISKSEWLEQMVSSKQKSLHLHHPKRRR